MAKTSSLEIFLRGAHEVSELSVLNSSAEVDVVVLLKGLIDIDKELGRLSQALQKIGQQKASLLQRLSNRAFVDNAPPEVVNAQTRAPSSHSKRRTTCFRPRTAH